MLKKCGDILAIRWHKRSVHMLTIVNMGKMKHSKVKHSTGNPVLKPDAVLDYKVNMRLVNKSARSNVCRSKALFNH